MKPIITYLESIGLSKTEAQLYTAGLKRPLTLEDLLKHTTIKQSTAYHALSTLQDKGLVSRVRNEGKLLFTMMPPEQLAVYLENQSRALERKHLELEYLLPSFPVSTLNVTETYRVEHYDSVEGIKKVVDMALNCKDPNWRIIAPKQNFFSEYDQGYARYYLSKRQVHKIRAKTLWEAPIRTENDGRLTLRDIVARNPRYLPVKFRGQFTAVIILFDDKVAYLSSLTHPESVLIQSTDFSSTMQVLFDGLWDASKDVLH